MNGGTFYLADYYTTTIREWADQISTQLHGKRNRSASAWVVKVAARAGDVAKQCGVANPPLTSFRLRNMATPTADVPIANIEELTGELPFSQAEGVRLTLQWLKGSERNVKGKTKGVSS